MNEEIKEDRNINLVRKLAATGLALFYYTLYFSSTRQHLVVKISIMEAQKFGMFSEFCCLVW
jgi:hypothetical protein